MNVFFLNLNDVHEAGEKSIYWYNHDLITNWQRTVDSPQVDVHWPLLHFNNYSKYMSTNETSKPFFDYYLAYREFDLDEIEKLYQGTDVRISRETFEHFKSCIDKNVELVKQQKPDIVCIRLYAYYEFFVLYFLDQIKDVDCKTVIGGTDFGFNNFYYIDKIIEAGLVTNFHDGYGERNLRSILLGEDVPVKTEDFCFLVDDFSEPTSDTHYIISTLKCNGSCSFCVHNRAARNTIKSDVQFTSDDYVDFITDRLKYFQGKGVRNIFVPASITFYNTKHLERFHEYYTKKNLNVKFVDTYFKFEDITEETVPLLQDMNWHSLKMGLESINKGLRLAVGKTYETEHVHQVTRLLQQTDIRFKYSFIYNFPFTNHETLLEDYRFIKQYGLKYIAFNRYELYNETDLEINPEENNLRRCVNDYGYVYYERIDKSTLKTNILKIMEKELANLIIKHKDVKQDYLNGYVGLYK